MGVAQRGGGEGCLKRLRDRSSGKYVYWDAPKAVLYGVFGAAFCAYLIYEGLWSLQDGTYWVRGGRRESGVFGVVWNVLVCAVGVLGCFGGTRLLLAARRPVLEFRSQDIRLHRGAAGRQRSIPWADIRSIEYCPSSWSTPRRPEAVFIHYEKDGGRSFPPDGFSRTQPGPVVDRAMLVGPLEMPLKELAQRIEAIWKADNERALLRPTVSTTSSPTMEVPPHFAEKRRG